LRELGVEGIEGSAEVETTQALSSRSDDRTETFAGTESAALRRNAEMAARAPSPQPSAPANASRAGSAQSSAEHTDMAKRTTKLTPELEPPPPQETLFGHITPKDEASLPRPNETLEDIWNDVGECIRCPLHATRTHVVHSEGNRQARLMFIGEAPGADEDMQARPFVGRAGQLLNKIIEAIGLKREDVMIGNVNRCRPPQNRTPTLAEAATCKPFLLREIDIIRPEVIVVLGNTAMKNLLDTKEGITKLRGKFQDYRGIKVMPTFHPAYLLRDPSKKREAWEDMKTVRDYLDGKLKT
jgi:DNA polymerase